VSHQNNLLRDSIKNSYRVQQEEAEREEAKKRSNQRSKGTQIACVSCALSENPKYHEDDAFSIGSTTVAEVVCKPALTQALKGDVILIARPRNILRDVVDTQHLPVDLIHAETSFDDSFVSLMGGGGRKDNNTNTNTNTMTFNKIRPASAYPYPSNIMQSSCYLYQIVLDSY
jgi:hypothetical protein